MEHQRAKHYWASKPILITLAPLVSCLLNRKTLKLELTCCRVFYLLHFHQSSGIASDMSFIKGQDCSEKSATLSLLWINVLIVGVYILMALREKNDGHYTTCRQCYKAYINDQNQSADHLSCNWCLCRCICAIATSIYNHIYGINRKQTIQFNMAYS